MLNFSWEVDGVLTDADTVKFSDPTGAYGMRRSDTAEIIIANDVDWTHAGTGLYEYDEVPLELLQDVVYDYWIETFYEGDYTRLQRFITGEGELVNERILQFVCVYLGEYLELDSAPVLCSPTESFGIRRMDTNETIVSANTPFFANGTLYSVSFGQLETNVRYRYYVKAILSGGSDVEIIYYVPRTTQYMNSANLVIGRYTDSIKIESMFGVDNVHKWMALDDGDEAVDYAMREYDFISQAEQQVDDMVSGYYIREEFEAPIPAVIVDAATAIAGCLMYEARGVTDTDSQSEQPQHKYASHRRRAEKVLGRVKTGRKRLPTSYPASIPDYHHRFRHRTWHR